MLVLSIYLMAMISSGLSLRFLRHAFLLNFLVILFIGIVLYHVCEPFLFRRILVVWLVPFQAINTLLYGWIPSLWEQPVQDKRYHVRLPISGGTLHLKNIRRGASIIGSAGSGKTESIVYNLLQHFKKHQFCGVIHDYKHFEITEMVYPVFKDPGLPFHIVSFDDIHAKVNPIAPRYLEDEESVNEVSRVLLENLLEQRETHVSGSSKFFNDAVEGLLGGLIWKLKTVYPEYCTLPHLMATFQYLETGELIDFLSDDHTSRAMANAFISGQGSERQTAGVLSTLANALKKISTPRIFMTLSADEVPLNINNILNPAVISIVNNPKYETAYAPVIATIIHTIIKQMSVRDQRPSFILMEEAPTIRLLNMHRIPATLRSYDISTVYVLQDRIQNDLMYGEKASRAILSNLSYQFFGKVNDPDTAKYYERFFEIIKRPTKSISKSHTWNFDARITTGEKEVSKIRSDVFFRLKLGEFITFADGKDRKVQFKTPEIKRELPSPTHPYNDAEIQANFERIHYEVRSIFQQKTMDKK